MKVSLVTKLMSHIIGIRKKADSQKGAGEAADSRKRAGSQKRGPQANSLETTELDQRLFKPYFVKFL